MLGTCGMDSMKGTHTQRLYYYGKYIHKLFINVSSKVYTDTCKCKKVLYTSDSVSEDKHIFTACS